MMANAQKEIEERKKALMTMKGEDKSEAVSLAVATAQIKAQGSVPGLTKPGLFSKPGVFGNCWSQCDVPLW